MVQASRLRSDIVVQASRLHGLRSDIVVQASRLRSDIVVQASRLHGLRSDIVVQASRLHGLRSDIVVQASRLHVQPERLLHDCMTTDGYCDHPSWTSSSIPEKHTSSS